MYSTVEPPPGDPRHPEARVHAAVDGVHDALDLLTTADLDLLGTQDLRLLTGRLLQVGHRVDAATLRLVHHLDRRGVAVERGQTSTAAWLRAAHRLHPATATRLVRTAKALHDDPAGPLVAHPDDGVIRPRQELRDAFAAGQVSAEHVAVITTAVTALPDTVDPVVRTDAETALVQAAAAHDPKTLAHIGTHLRHTLDDTGGQDLADTEDHQVATRELQIRLQNDGSSKVRGQFDPELTAALCSQLNPLAAPQPATDGHHDLRTPAQRNADALAELLRRYAAADLSPTSHGAPATVTVTMTLDTLQQRAGAPAANLDWCGPISASTARRIACDARIIPVLLASNGEPLDVGLLLPGHPSHLAGPGRPRRRLRVRRLRPAAGMDPSPPPDPLGRLRRDLHRQLLPVLRLPPPRRPPPRLGRRPHRRRHPRHPTTLDRLHPQTPPQHPTSRPHSASRPHPARPPRPSPTTNPRAELTTRDPAHDGGCDHTDGASRRAP